MRVIASTRMRLASPCPPGARRKAHDDVGEAHEHGAEPAPEVAGDQAEHASDDHREQAGRDRDAERVLRTDDDAREDAAPEVVGAQDVEPAGVERSGRQVTVFERDLRRRVPDQRRTDHGSSGQDQEEDRRRQSSSSTRFAIARSPTRLARAAFT